MAFIVYGMGKRIEEVRNEKGLKNEQVAELVGISDVFYSAIQNDRKGMSMETFVKLCEALDASADYLLFGKK